MLTPVNKCSSLHAFDFRVLFPQTACFPPIFVPCCSEFRFSFASRPLSRMRAALVAAAATAAALVPQVDATCFPHDKCIFHQYTSKGTIDYSWDLRPRCK